MASRQRGADLAKIDQALQLLDVGEAPVALRTADP